MMDDIERAALDLRVARGRRRVVRRLRRRAATAGLMISGAIVCSVYGHPLWMALTLLWSLWPIAGALGAWNTMYEGEFDRSIYAREGDDTR